MNSRTPIVLITRFSLPHPAWHNRSPYEYASWLQERMSLFKRLTINSVHNNYVKPDIWLVLAQNHGTLLNQEIDDLVAKAATPYSIIQYSGRNIPGTVSSFLQNHPLGSAKRICTVRLDSDDLISADYFARLRTCVDHCDSEQQSIGLSFPGGSILDDTNRTFYYSSYPDNPFISLIESISNDCNIQTVYTAMHHQLLSTLPKTMYLRTDRPMWCSVIHHSNLGNQSLLASQPTRLDDSETLMRRFGLVT